MVNLLNSIPISNYPGYFINEIGNIIGPRGKILKPDMNSTGYLRVTLSRAGEVKRFFVHRLVAEHFCVNHEGLPSVNHKDGNRKNNSKYNLEWCTNSYNVKDGFLRGRKVHNKFSKDLQERIYSLYKFGLNKRDIARYLSIDVGAVLRVVRARDE